MCHSLGWTDQPSDKTGMAAHYPIEGQAVFVDVPASARRHLPERYFVLTSLVGRDAVLRADQPLTSVITGVPVTLAVGNDGSLLQGVLVGRGAPDSITVRLSSAPERRLARRTALELDAELEPIEGQRDAPLHAKTIDFSATGMRVRSVAPIERGTQVFVVVDPDGARPVMAIADVLDSSNSFGALFYEVRLALSSIADEHRERLGAWLAEARLAGASRAS